MAGPAAAPRQLAALWSRLEELQSTRRTSLAALRSRRPPAPYEYADFGSGSVVVPPASVDRPSLVSIGEGVLLHEEASILVAATADGIQIGDGTVLSRCSHIGCALRVTIGRQVSSSDHVAIIDTWGPIDGGVAHPVPPEPVVIEDGAYLGFGCIVGPGVTVGAGAFIGEGAVVLDDVAPHSVVYGNPAATIRQWTPSGWEGTRVP